MKNVIKSEQFLIVNKNIREETGDIIDKTRKITEENNGHAGSIDPFGAGQIVIVLRKSKNVINIFKSMNKDYSFIAKRGVKKNTEDWWGKTIRRVTLKYYSREIIEEMVGRLYQIPPKFSALKYKGNKICKYARINKVIILKPRIRISIELIVTRRYDNNYCNIKTEKGCYIRSITKHFGRMINENQCTLKLNRNSNNMLESKKITSKKKMLRKKQKYIYTREYFWDTEYIKIYVPNYNKMKK